MAQSDELIGNGVWIMGAMAVAAVGLGWLILRTVRGSGSSAQHGSGCGTGGTVGGGCSSDTGGGHHGHSDGSSGCGSSGCGASGCGGGGCGGS